MFETLSISFAIIAVNVVYWNPVSATVSQTVTSNVPALTLNTGKKIPSLGYGTSRANNEELEKALDSALEAGYRHIDTANFYENEEVIGKVIKRWIEEGKLKREDLFLVTKLPPVGNRRESVFDYLKGSLEKLQVNYVDLYLIHAPFGFKENKGNKTPTTPDGNIELDMSTNHSTLWEGMEEQMNAGLTKAIGLSNFNKTQIERLLKNCKIRPSALQVEIHAYLQQNELVDFCQKNDIVVVAFSPLGSRSIASSAAKNGKESNLPNILENPIVKAIAKKHSKTEAQILLRFDIQRGIIPIPKSSNYGRMRENLNIFDFELDDKDMQELKSLEAGIRFFDFKSLKGLEKHHEYPF